MKNRTQKLAEYTYLSNTYSYLGQVLQQNRNELRKQMGNPIILGAIERVRNDMALIVPLLTKLQTEILESYQKEENIEFKYLLNQNKNVKSEKPVNGSQPMQIAKGKKE
jgi:iron-sulfur cluster repair protein YtfE (RIC family)